MSTITATCEHCRSNFTAPTQDVGRMIKCPLCAEQIQVRHRTPNPSVIASQKAEPTPVAINEIRLSIGNMMQLILVFWVASFALMVLGFFALLLFSTVITEMRQ